MYKGKLNVVLFPVGVYDTAGNKRLANLAKQFTKLDAVEVSFIRLLGDTGQKEGQSRFIYIIQQIFYLGLNLFYACYLIIKNYKKGYDNLLYFYEGKHITPFRTILAHWLGYKVAIDMVEDPYSILKVSSFGMKMRMRFFLMIYKHLDKFVDFVVVVSSLLQKRIEDDFNNKLPVYLLPVTYEPSDFDVEPYKYEHFTLLYGGSFGPNYDFESFCLAFDNMQKEYPDIKLCLTGKVNEDVRSMIKRYIKNENSVLFLGFLDDKKYYSCVKGADILCMPRNNSIHANAGFPFKLAEYLATGKPVITSLASDVSFYLTEDDAFMYNSGDQKTIESYIKLIITDKQEAMRRGRNGQKKAEMCFNNLKVTTDFLTFVRNTCYKE